jgi:hypothetical protein
MTEYVREGDPVDGNNGGGFIGSMELVGNTVHFKKVDANGKPHRDFGVVAGRASVNAAGADSKKVPLIVDAVCVSAEGFTVLYDEEQEPDTITVVASGTIVPEPAQDPPSAQPVQKQNNQGQQRR